MKGNKKISLRRIKQLFIFMGLALFFLSVAIPANLTYAQRRVKPEVVLPKHYPNGFHGFGRLYNIEGDAVVIDDGKLRLSPSVEYHTPDEVNASKYSFHPGDLVGFLTNSENEIISLWLIK